MNISSMKPSKYILVTKTSLTEENLCISALGQVLSILIFTVLWKCTLTWDFRFSGQVRIGCGQKGWHTSVYQLFGGNLHSTSLGYGGSNFLQNFITTYQTPKYVFYFRWKGTSGVLQVMRSLMNLVIMLMHLLHHKIMLIFTAVQKLKLNSNLCLVWVVRCKLFSDEKFT